MNEKSKEKKLQLIPLSKRALVMIAAAVAAIVLVIALRSLGERIAEHKRRMAFDNLHAATVSRIAELSVLEYRYTDVMELNRKFVVGGSSTSLVRFSGVVKAGIADVTAVRADYDADAGKIEITLPRSSIIENVVDVGTVKFWDIKRNIFVPIKTELKLQEISAFKEKVARELEASGFLSEADARAAEIVSSLYSGFGAHVTVTH